VVWEGYLVRNSTTGMYQLDDVNDCVGEVCQDNTMVRKTPIFCDAFLYQEGLFYQDRLGTDIGKKALKK
jgi:hypothetical protein